VQVQVPIAEAPPSTGSGTSIAAPHVAGLLLLCHWDWQDVRPDAFRELHQGSLHASAHEKPGPALTPQRLPVTSASRCSRHRGATSLIRPAACLPPSTSRWTAGTGGSSGSSHLLDEFVGFRDRCIHIAQQFANVGLDVRGFAPE
jgi:hypothetical protein